MIVQITLGVAFGIVLAATILAYWRQALFFGLILLPVAAFLILAMWLFNHPEILITLFVLWTYAAYYGGIAIMSVLVWFVGIIVLYAILLGPCVAYEGIKGKRLENEIFVVFSYIFLGLVFGHVLIWLLPLSQMVKNILVAVYIFALIAAPWLTAFGWKHSPKLSDRFKWLQAKTKQITIDG